MPTYTLTCPATKDCDPMSHNIDAESPAHAKRLLSESLGLRRVPNGTEVHEVQEFPDLLDVGAPTPQTLDKKAWLYFPGQTNEPPTSIRTPPSPTMPGRTTSRRRAFSPEQALQTRHI